MSIREHADAQPLVRILRHQRCEGPGYLAEFLGRYQVPYELVCIDEGLPVPMGLEGVGGLVLMGSASSVNDPHAWIAQELMLVRQAMEQDVPVMGVCFGGQLISRALGGRVLPGPRGMEIGWHPVQRVQGCDCRGWLDGLPSEITSFHWHSEVFTVPDGAVPLLHSRSLYNQAFSQGRHLAMQFHLEMPEEQLTGALEARLQGLHTTADVIYGTWLRRAGLLA
jgi:GMP synthase-like glutamine amidotransferase